MGEFDKAKSPGSSASQWKIPLISPEKTGLHLIDSHFNYTSSLLSWRSLLRTTANKDHKSTREMNLAIKRQEEWGNSLVANSRSGNVIPPATLSSVGTRTVVFTLTSDTQTTDQSDARSGKIYSLSGNLSCLFFCNLLWEITSPNEE